MEVHCHCSVLLVDVDVKLGGIKRGWVLFVILGSEDGSRGVDSEDIKDILSSDRRSRPTL
jgi:hypothetical protein